MSTATVTSKGQITIPKDVREHLGLCAGDKIDLQVRADGVVELVPRRQPLMALRGALKSAVRGVSLDDMDRAIAHGAAGGEGE